MHRIIRFVTLCAVITFVLASACSWHGSSKH